MYFVAIFAGKAAMHYWPAWDLSTPLKYWNLALSLFSTIGMLRTVPQLVHNLATRGLDATVRVCAPPCASAPAPRGIPCPAGV